MVQSGVIDTPSEQDIRHTMTRALEVQLARYRGQQWSEDALRERVTAVRGRLLPAPQPGWWHIGTIYDELADIELDIWCRPPGIRLLTRTPYHPLTDASPIVDAPDAL